MKNQKSKLFLLIVIWVAILAILVTFWIVRYERVYEARQETYERTKLRAEIGSEWINSTLEYALATNEAVIAVNFVSKHINLAYPSVDGTIVPTAEIAEEEKYPLFILPLLPTDRHRGENWARFLDQKYCFIAYDPITKSFAINTTMKCGKKVEAMMMIHESMHAYRDAYFHTEFMQRVASEDDVEKAWEEVAAFSLQCKNTRAVGGKPYLKFLEEEIKRMEDEIVATGISLERGQYPERLAYPQLDGVFGAPLSRIEADYRDTGFWVDAYFALVERHVAYEKRGIAKARFIAAWYKGISPNFQEE